MRYAIQHIDHLPFTARLNAARITTPLKVEPAPYMQSTGFRASGLYGCLRQVGYRLAKTAPTHDTYEPDYQLAADQGTALHCRIQEQLVASGLAVTHQGTPAIEVVIQTPLLSGHIDAVIRTKAGTLAIFDLKSVAAKYMAPNYMAYKTQGYATQVSAYMAAFAMEDGEQAREAYVLMMSRDDTSNRALLRIPWQPEVWACDVARLEAAQAAVSAGALPMAEPGGCRFCSYRGLCDANDWRGA